jgi:histidyl-tRNA synthetase
MYRYAIDQIRVPMLERAQLYQRTTGETSDIVEKQMYTFSDRDEAETVLALRPEGTPGVVRAYIEAGLDRSDPEQRLWYSGAMFRRERPQKGRYRQFYQFGVEIFGRADAACDAELLIMIDDLRRDLGLTLRTELNSLGCSDCRPAYRAALLEYGRAHLDTLCHDCHQRLERNPLRLLDCKIDVAIAQNAPKTLDYLCEACRAHFGLVQKLITAASVQFSINPRLVRGLDYYTRTAFEVLSGDVGSQSAVVAGGRYDGLVEALGGASVAGIGFAIGVDRMALALQTAGLVAGASLDAALIAIGERALAYMTPLARTLRESGLAIEALSPDRKLKALLTRAAKIGARFAVIAGDSELERGAVQLRDLSRSEQREVSIAELPAAIRAARQA